MQKQGDRSMSQSHKAPVEMVQFPLSSSAGTEALITVIIHDFRQYQTPVTAPKDALLTRKRMKQAESCVVFGLASVHYSVQYLCSHACTHSFQSLFSQLYMLLVD